MKSLANFLSIFVSARCYIIRGFYSRALKHFFGQNFIHPNRRRHYRRTGVRRAKMLEKFLDLVKPRLHYHVEVIKDVMAAAVLLASFGSVIIGLFIFIPHLVELVSQ